MKNQKPDFEALLESCDFQFARYEGEPIIVETTLHATFECLKCGAMIRHDMPGPKATGVQCPGCAVSYTVEVRLQLPDHP